MISSILIAGSGNLAWHWANMLTHSNGSFDKVDLYARNKKAANAISNDFRLHSFTQLSQLDNQLYDLIILAVSDDALEMLSSQFVDFKGIVVHCAGSVSLNQLNDEITNKGVIYPLQTFSKGKTMDYSQVHFFAEANSREVAEALKPFIQKISPHICFYTSDQRQALHVSAVLVNNFTNHLMVLAHHICQDQQVDYRALIPLMKETAAKLEHLEPAEAQTGPAIRNNQKIIHQHLKWLEKYPHIAPLYKLLSESIINFNELKNG